MAPARASAQEEPLLVTAGQRIEGDLSSATRDIVVEGEVTGDVTTWTGSITVRGHVYGDVVSYGGPILLADTARVDGNVLALGGALQRSSGALVVGQAIGDTPLGGAAVAGVLTLVGGLRQDIGGLPGAVVSAVLGISALLLATLIALVWPRRTAGASRTLLDAPARSIALGLLTTLLLALLLLPAATLLAVTLIGLPLILLLLALLQIPYLCGLATLAQALGRRLRGRADAADAGRATALGVLLLLLPLVGLGALSLLWSAALFYLLTSAGLGALIISRGGAFAPAPA